MEVQTPEIEALTPADMLKLAIDWTGGCPHCPGNSDVNRALIECGVPPQKLLELAHMLARGAWTRYAAAHLILEILSARHVRAAIALHGHQHHGLTLFQARRDVEELHGEARQIAQREVLMTVQTPAEGGQSAPS